MFTLVLRTFYLQMQLTIITICTKYLLNTYLAQIVHNTMINAVCIEL